MKNQVIAALIVLQVVSTGFWFSQVKSANQSEATCQMKMVIQTRSIINLLNQIEDELDAIEDMKVKTTFRPKIVVSK